jgi:hypothetical protein
MSPFGPFVAVVIRVDGAGHDRPKNRSTAGDCLTAPHQAVCRASVVCGAIREPMNLKCRLRVFLILPARSL